MDDSNNECELNRSLARCSTRRASRPVCVSWKQWKRWPGLHKNCILVN